jgi:hypothetical protein
MERRKPSLYRGSMFNYNRETLPYAEQSTLAGFIQTFGLDDSDARC